MSSFRYTKNQDYNPADSISSQGYYKSYPYNGNLSTYSSGDASDVEGRTVEPSYRDVLMEFSSEGRRVLSDSAGNELYFESTGFSLDYSDISTNIYITGGLLGDYIYSGSGDDALYGYDGNDHLNGFDGNDIIEGGRGADVIDGGNGINTAVYWDTSAGVTVNLGLGNAAQVSAQDANGDILYNISNLIGGYGADTLTGNAAANVLTGREGNDTLRGMGGADTLNGDDGNDQLIITDGGSSVHGGRGSDKLLLQGADSFTFINATFDGIEAVYVAKGATLDLSAVTSGVSITSQSAIGTSVAITGTMGADTISAGKGTDLIHGGAGNDTIKGGSGYALLFGDDGIDTIRAGAGGATMDGGEGGDRLYGGAASDTFVFGADIGQDNVYNFQSGSDHLDVSAIIDSFLDVNIRVVNGKDTLVTFDGVDPAIKFVLRGVSSVQEGDFDFGTQPTALAHHDWAI